MIGVWGLVLGFRGSKVLLKSFGFGIYQDSPAFLSTCVPSIGERGLVPNSLSKDVRAEKTDDNEPWRG